MVTMNAPRKKDGTFASTADLNHLVEMVKNETDIIQIYDWLDANFKDPRTKWGYLKEAKKLAIDNGE